MKDYYTIAEFCTLAGFSRQYLYHLWNTGDGPARERVRVGRTTEIHIDIYSASEWLTRRLSKRTTKQFSPKEGNYHVQY